MRSARREREFVSCELLKGGLGKNKTLWRTADLNSTTKQGRSSDQPEWNWSQKKGKRPARNIKRKVPEAKKVFADAQTRAVCIESWER